MDQNVTKFLVKRFHFFLMIISFINKPRGLQLYFDKFEVVMIQVELYKLYEYDSMRTINDEMRMKEIFY